MTNYRSGASQMTAPDYELPMPTRIGKLRYACLQIVAVAIIVYATFKGVQLAYSWLSPSPTVLFDLAVWGFFVMLSMTSLFAGVALTIAVLRLLDSPRVKGRFK